MRLNTRTSSVAALAALLVFAAVDRCLADFTLGSAANYGLLYEGNGGKTLNYNAATITGNVGIGGTGSFQGNGPGGITGNLDFSAANSNQFTNSGLTIGAVNYSVSAVTSGLSNVNTISHDLGLASGTNAAISNGGSITASGGTQIANG